MLLDKVKTFEIEVSNIGYVICGAVIFACCCFFGGALVWAGQKGGRQ